MRTATSGTRGGDSQGLLVVGVCVAGPVDRVSPRTQEIQSRLIDTARQIGLAVKLRPGF
jgi:hypothetical protein